MVLLNHVVEIFKLAYLDGRLTIGIARFERSEIGAVFFDGHRIGRAILGDRLLEVTPCGGLVALRAKQKIDRVTSFIDGPVQVFPFILDLEWSKKQGVVELFPCFSSPVGSRTGARTGRRRW
jgi:hypothetical protein